MDLPVFFNSSPVRLGFRRGWLGMDRGAVCVSMTILIACVIVGGLAGIMRFLSFDRGGRKIQPGVQSGRRRGILLRSRL